MQGLAALNPPQDLSTFLHARIAEMLRTLKRNGASDTGVTRPADLSDSELEEAAGILRAFRALPWWTEAGYQGGTGLRITLSEYALGLASEIDTRTTHHGQPPFDLGLRIGSG